MEGIWDSHIHILPPRRTRGLVRWIKKAFPQHPSREDYTPDDILGELRLCGVEMAFNMVFPLKDSETEELNRFSREIADRYENVVPFGSLHADTPEKDEVAERCVTHYGLAGMKLHPYVQGFEAFSDVFKPLYRKLNELEKPLIVHTGFDVFYGKTQDLDYLASVIEDYPDMPLVLVHSLFPRFELAERLVADNGNVYLDMTNVMSAVRYYRESPSDSLSGQVDSEKMTESIDHFFKLICEHHERIMFGTDHPAGMGSVEQIYDDFDSFGFDDGIRESLLGGTAKRLLERCDYEIRCR